MKTKKSLSEIYSFPGFRARARFKKGILGDQKARVLDLLRRPKKRFVQVAAELPGVITTSVFTALEISTAGICGSIWNSNTAESNANTARP